MLIVLCISHIMSVIDSTKKVYLIVHGQRQLVDPVKEKLANKFRRENMQPASLDKAGEVGEYVAMLWPPMAAKEIVVSQITGTGGSGGQGMGAWSSVSQKELFRVSL
jgi:hypothetical protein